MSYIDHEFEDDFDEDEEEDYYEEEDIITIACDECDYRWRVSPEEEEEAVCPMCGSSNVAEI